MKNKHTSAREASTRGRFAGHFSLLGFMPILVLCLAWQPVLRAATLSTDKPDYLPGEHVTFTGSGWTPGETVSIDVYESSLDPILWVDGVSAVADLTGHISNSDLL